MYAHEETFLNQVEGWLHEQGELFVVIQGDFAIDRNQYALITSMKALQEMILDAPEKSMIFVYQEKQLPLRGIANETFLESALHMIQEPEDYLLLDMSAQTQEKQNYFHSDTSWELRGMFPDFLNKNVAFGKMPLAHLYDKRANNVLQAKILIHRVPLREVRVILYETNIKEKEVEDEIPLGQATKLGGSPDWIQHDETPSCPTCGWPMVFVAQIDSIDYNAVSKNELSRQVYMFGDVGMIYVFFCFSCGQTTSIFQCY
ncbi:MAG: hypothetical protein IPL78_29355 [Chloroflexi bacterium]|nr:hypothetical protein [Chloroflexota bacterium]